MSERAAEHEARKEQWLGELADFIVEAGQNGWAAEAPKVEDPQRPGFKELAYERGDWAYRDSYAGYYMAPGSSVVYYKGRPVWYMTYGGPGQDPEYYERAKETFAFLRKALMQPEPSFPVRGPSHFYDESSNKSYAFGFVGTLAEGAWWEEIWEDTDPQNDLNTITFRQRGDVGLIIDKGEGRKPIYPWDL